MVRRKRSRVQTHMYRTTTVTLPFAIFPFAMTLCLSTSSGVQETVEPVMPRLSQDKSRLERHERSFLGINRDENYDAHLDITVSFKVQLADERSWGGLTPYVTLSARFSQYIFGAQSSPVIGRRFNPEFVLRYTEKAQDIADSADSANNGDKLNTLDVGYGHESNGQGIDSVAEFNARKRSLQLDGEDEDFARKNLSRGWDYIGFTWIRNLPPRRTSRARTFLKLRYFLETGLLQDGAEEYYSFEGGIDPGGRAHYDGVGLWLRSEFSSTTLGDWHTAIGYETGYRDAFEHSTLKLELSNHNLRLPISVWARTGYNSDLASYYERSTSIGIGVEF